MILPFNDSECPTICPLTTTGMVDAKAMLGRASSQVQLLGVDANPTVIAIADMRAHAELHGMVHEWHFLTGSPAQIEQMWNAYRARLLAAAVSETQGIDDCAHGSGANSTW